VTSLLWWTRGSTSILMPTSWYWYDVTGTIAPPAGLRDEVTLVLKPGDIDVPGNGVMREPDEAVLVQIGSDRTSVKALTNTEGLLRRSLQLEESAIAFTCTVRVPVVFTQTGWTYKDRPVKVGAPFTFESISGAMIGRIVDMKLDQERVRSGS